MGRIGVAIRAFFSILFNGVVARQVGLILRGEEPVKTTPTPAPAPVEPIKKTPAKAPGRSDSLSLLAAMQREARLIDFLKEPITAYSDAQIGAVVRDIHRDCGALVERVFAVRPLLESAENAEVDVPVGFDAGRFRLTGNVTGQPPHRGRLCHHGWEATKSELPAWTGGEAAARVIAPAEVELK